MLYLYQSDPPNSPKKNLKANGQNDTRLSFGSSRPAFPTRLPRPRRSCYPAASPSCEVVWRIPRPVQGANPWWTLIRSVHFCITSTFSWNHSPTRALLTAFPASSSRTVFYYSTFKESCDRGTTELRGKRRLTVTTG